ncbi:hypothetical protein ACTFIU_004049 [Dictyostelium citrinum]
MEWFKYKKSNENQDTLTKNHNKEFDIEVKELKNKTYEEIAKSKYGSETGNIILFKTIVESGYKSLFLERSIFNQSKLLEILFCAIDNDHSELSLFLINVSEIYNH